MKLFVLFFMVLFVFACKNTSAIKSPSSAISLMSYNVENLFDSIDDPGKKDETYLPKELKANSKHKTKCYKVKRKRWRDQCLYWDWSEAVVNEKLRRLTEVILSSKPPIGPEVVVLQEVENLNILKKWNNEFLKKSKYKIVHIEGDDLRGIDIAVLTRLPVVGKPTLHKIPFKKISKKQKHDSRGILQVSLQLPNSKLLQVYGVHFPAPFHPYQLRIQAFQFLSQLQLRQPKGSYAIAAGDFNVPKAEDKKHKILEKWAGKHWFISHKEGCAACKGTNYYPPKNSWSFLDMILWSKNMSIDPKSVRVFNSASEQKNIKGYPQSFRVSQKAKVIGVSDHWPLLVDIAAE